MRGNAECAVRDPVNIPPIDKGSCGRMSRLGRSAKRPRTPGRLRSSCPRLPGACPACCALPPSAARSTRHARCRPSQARERPSPARCARGHRRPLRHAGRCASRRSNDRTRHRESSGGDIRRPPLCGVRPSAASASCNSAEARSPSCDSIVAPSVWVRFAGWTGSCGRAWPEHADAHVKARVTTMPAPIVRVTRDRPLTCPRLLFAAETRAPPDRVRNDQREENCEQDDCCGVHRHFLLGKDPRG